MSIDLIESLVPWLGIVQSSVHIVATGSLGSWQPLSGLPWQDAFFVHFIDFFQSQTFSFANKEEDVEEGEDQTAHEDVTVVEVNGTSDEWSEEGNQETPDPVSSSCNGHGLGLDSQWESFRDNNISDWSPGGSETEDVETGEDDHTVTGTLGRAITLTIWP